MTAIESFWAWFRGAQRELLEASSPAVAELIHQRLRSSGWALGVEVSSPDEEEIRDIIFTAHSDSSLYPLVEGLVEAAPPTPRWRPIALKPALGFDFVTRMDGVDLNASQLRFDPLAGAGFVLGICLYCPELPEVGDDVIAGVLWQVLETGVGERAASRIGELQFGDHEDGPDALPIEELARYIEWHYERGPGKRE